MQVRQRMRSQSAQYVVHLSAPEAVAAPLVVIVNKTKLIDCVQMLHANECQTLDESGVVNVMGIRYGTRLGDLENKNQHTLLLAFWREGNAVLATSVCPPGPGP